MVSRTGGAVARRRAILALNLGGGAGFELWQYMDRAPRAPDFVVSVGDLGIFAAKIRSKDINAAFRDFRLRGVSVLSPAVLSDPAGGAHFFLQDPYGNTFQITQSDYSFAETPAAVGGVSGCLIGVSDMELSKRFYGQVLGYQHVVYETEGIFPDLRCVPGGNLPVLRARLQRTTPHSGHFTNMLGPSELELVQTVRGTPRRIFANRCWGDLGFIHLCFDVTGMDALFGLCAQHGVFPLVDSKTRFQMEDAAGRFSYVEDPDGMLVEFVETYRIPIVKKLHWHVDLDRRPVDKPLPNWILKLLRFNRVTPRGLQAWKSRHGNC